MPELIIILSVIFFVLGYLFRLITYPKINKATNKLEPNLLGWWLLSYYQSDGIAKYEKIWTNKLTQDRLDELCKIDFNTTATIMSFDEKHDKLKLECIKCFELSCKQTAVIDCDGTLLCNKHYKQTL